MKGKIFNAQEVQAIIAGNKTMFREVIKPKINLENYSLPDECGMELLLSECPYQVGETIFVKESFSKLLIHSGHQYYYPAHCIRECVDRDNGFHYWADGNPEFGDWESPRPATHMKQEHSRITLEITGIKVERLAEISKEDAIKEGATSRPNCHGYANRYEGWCMNWNKVGEASKWASNKTLSESDVCMGSAQYAFGNFWNATHKKPEEKFEANPFVWVVDFKINK